MGVSIETKFMSIDWMIINSDKVHIQELSHIRESITQEHQQSVAKLLKLQTTDNIKDYKELL